MRGSKAQISIEYLVVVGFVFVILVSLLYYSFHESTTHINLNQAEDAVLSLINTADAVYTLGSGSQDLVWITLPGGIESFTLTGRTISLEVNIKGKPMEVHYRALANLTGTLPTTKGTYRIKVQALDNATVSFETS